MMYVIERGADGRRVIRTLYATLFDNRIIASSKHASYLNVLFKAMKIDPDMNR